MNNASTKILLGPLVIFALLLSICAFYQSQHKQPWYSGSSLGSWMRGFDYHKATPEQQKLAVEAVSHIGTNAIPFLLSELGAQEPKNPARIFHVTVFGVASERQKRAVRAFAALGEAGKHAIPALNKLLDSEDINTVVHTIRVLSEMVQDGAWVMSRALTNANSDICCTVVNMLYNMGTNASVAAYRLVQCLNDSKPEIAYHAASALSRIEVDSGALLPILLKNLKSTNPTCRAASAMILGSYTNQITIVAPALVSLSNDPNTDVREAASNSIHELTK